jgi:hypothetical protein
MASTVTQLWSGQSKADWCRFFIREINLNDVNFMKIYQLVYKLLVGKNGQTGRQTGDIINLTFIFQKKVA